MSPCTFQGMPYEPYFRGVEAIMDELGGRPHWGKRHFQTQSTLRAPVPGLGPLPVHPRGARSDGPLRQRVHRPGAGRAGRFRARGLEEGLSLAAVGAQLVDDPVAGQHVQGVEALAQLAGLGVTHPHAVADPQPVGGRADERSLDLSGPLAAVEAQAMGQVGTGKPIRPAAPEAGYPPPSAVTIPGPGWRTTGNANSAAGLGAKER